MTESSQPDLYWALRGGMGNFGIVTHFNMTAVPQGQIFGGNVAFTEDKKDAVVAAAYDLTFSNDTAAVCNYPLCSPSPFDIGCIGKQ